MSERIESQHGAQNVSQKAQEAHQPAPESNTPVREVEGSRSAIREIPLRTPDIDLVMRNASIVQNAEFLFCKRHRAHVKLINHVLTVTNKNISNEQLRQIIEEIKDLNISSIILDRCENITEIDFSSELNIQRFNCFNCPRLSKLNLNGLKKLDKLYCQGCTRLSELNLNGLKKLEILDCLDCTSLTRLDVSTVPNLKDLFCSGCSSITDFTFGDNLDLTHFECSNTGITALDISRWKNLEILNCSNCTRLESLDLRGATKTSTIDCSYCPNLSNLNLSGLIELKDLTCCCCKKIKRLDLQGLRCLRNVSCFNCEQLVSINLEGCQNLYYFCCKQCEQLSGLSLSRLSSLVHLDCAHCRNITSLDLTGLGSLMSLDCSECRGLFELDLRTCPSITTISADLLSININLNTNSPFYRSIIENYEFLSSKICSHFDRLSLTTEERSEMENIVNKIKSHADAQKGQKGRALWIMLMFLNQAKAPFSPEDKTIFMTAMQEFDGHLTSCRDAFETGIIKLNTALNLKKLLSADKNLNRNIFFGIFLSKIIEETLGKFSRKWSQQPDNSSYSTHEIIEVQAFLNIIFNIPATESVSYGSFALKNTKLLASVIGSHSVFDEGVKLGNEFMAHYGINPMLKARLFHFFNDQDSEELFLSCKNAFALVITSLLRQKDNCIAFMAEEEYLPYIIWKEVLCFSIDELPAGTTISFLSSENLDDTKSKLKSFVASHKEELNESSELRDIFITVSLIENKTESDKLVENMLGTILKAENTKNIAAAKLAEEFQGDRYEKAIMSFLESSLLRQ